MNASTRWLLATLVLTLTACDSGSLSDSDGDAMFALTSLTCDVSGVNTDPFTVADALAANAADHEAAGDYSYDAPQPRASRSPARPPPSTEWEPAPTGARSPSTHPAPTSSREA